MTASLASARIALPPGASLGVLGGGQLGRMFVHAAQQLGYRTVVLDADASSPAGLVAHRHVAAAYDDVTALDVLGQACDAITTEFENVPAASLRHLAGTRPVAPAGDAVAVCQDRAAEKAWFGRSRVPCAPYAVIDSESSLDGVADGLLPGILKTARLGYDGKGQVRVADRHELAAAWNDLGRVTCVLEARLQLQAELSVIVARGRDGQVVDLPVQRNWHVDGILARTEVPSAIAAPLQAAARQSAAQLATAMDYVGVLCVEFFVVAGPNAAPTLVANEMAPRPHNSGHYSIDACDVSQFELQVRTLAGLPLVTPRLHSPCVMLNLLGDLWFDGHGQRREPDWPAVLAMPGVHLHLYGKETPKPGRKMGHLTVTADDAAGARAVADAVVAHLGLPTT